ncbi:MAG: cysteine desulfurase [Candidatus Yanofskybacteria bacterium]|nr:cysteine desulfurase [Candidatus Yanofskybacteria bacterium]
MAKRKTIYLDNAGTTPMDTRVERVVLKHMRESWGNASSVHDVGRQARGVIDDSRKRVARVLGVKSEEMIFTGSGTESDNLAIFGVARAYKTRQNFSKKNLGGLRGHIVTTRIEHPAVLRACQYLEKKEGFKITYIGVDKNGIVNPADIAKALRSDTILVSIMYANNEIGTVQPIVEISKAIKNFRQNLKTKTHNLKHFFHVDACQAAGALNLNVNQLGVDLMTLNGSKIYGPKGTGCLYVRRGVELVPQIVGGSQERGLRAGTENPALIAGFAKALELADENKKKESTRLIELRDYMIGQILKTIPGSHLNGDAVRRLPNNINISFENIDGEMLMLALDQGGIQVSTGSACTSTSTEPSHALKALGLSDELAKGNIRITLGRQTMKKDIDYVLKTLVSLVKKLRK